VRRRLFGDIVGAAARAAAVDGVPLTVKFRIGIDDAITTFLDAGRIAEAEGAAAVALHARTAEQRYSGSARWEAIAALKAAVTTIPVLGNGDIWEAGDAVAMMAETGCDGVVVGRGCLGRPWLFAELVDAFAGKPPSPPKPLGLAIDVMSRHADLLVADVGELNGMRSMRRHSQWYLQGYPVGGEVRRALGLVETRADLARLVGGLDPDLRQDPGATALPRGHTEGPRPVALPEGWLDLVDDPTPPVGAELLVSGG
jgi:nifR3 family TIM-barrel protein